MELRQAIVAMMNRKDELEEQNTYVRCCHYMLHTNTQYSHLNWKTISNDPFVLIVSADFFFFLYRNFFFADLGARNCFETFYFKQSATRNGDLPLFKSCSKGS